MATFVQGVAAGNSGPNAGGQTLNFASPVTAGSLLVLFGGGNINPTGFTFPGAYVDDATLIAYNATNARSIGTGYRLSAAGTEQNNTLGGGLTQPYCSCGLEFAGLTAAALDAFASANFTNDSTPTFPTISPTGGRDAVIVAVQMKQPATPNPGPQTLSGFTAGPDTAYAFSGNRYRMTTWYMLVSGTTGSYGGGTLSASTDGSEDGTLLLVSFVSGAPAVGRSQAVVIG